MAGLRGARTVIVGINPDTAAALARLGMPPGIAPTAADLDDAIAILEEPTV
jgi:rsbT antagonist protein RsbS